MSKTFWILLVFEVSSLDMTRELCAGKGGRKKVTLSAVLVRS